MLLVVALLFKSFLFLFLFFSFGFALSVLVADPSLCTDFGARTSYKGEENRPGETGQVGKDVDRVVLVISGHLGVHVARYVEFDLKSVTND